MYSWQDWVLAASIFALNVALVPSLWGKKKPRIATSVLTGVAVAPQLIAFASLSLWYSFCMAAINVTLWTILAVQAITMSRKPTSRG